MYLPEDESGAALPVWAAFGDLMACLLGVFVLFFVWIVSFEVSMAHDLASERAQRRAATERLATLESALAGPLRAGLITFVNGRIGIRGSVLFDLNSAELRAPGRQLLGELAAPLASYLSSREDALMVSGFTDDLQMRGGQRTYRDNWELSAQRALTVVRGLSEAGVPRDALFAAGFGENHPVAPNDTEENRAKNRRVEMAPVPRPRALSIEGSRATTRAATEGSRATTRASTEGSRATTRAATGGN
jgi:outer membrane protein OmpA-like peptidoglycan-associated protein